MEFSKRYLPDGKVSEELSDRIDKAFEFMYDIRDFLMKKQKTNDSFHFRIINSFLIDKVFVVGSILRGIDNSDVDLYFQIPNLDPDIYGFLKTSSFYFLCKDKQKIEWIDTYFGRERPGEGIFRGKEVYDISDQIKKRIENYNFRYQ